MFLSLYSILLKTLDLILYPTYLHEFRKRFNKNLQCNYNFVFMSKIYSINYYYYYIQELANIAY